MVVVCNMVLCHVQIILTQAIGITYVDGFSVIIFEGRQFPDKAIDLIDEACATARMQKDNILKGSTTHIVPENVANEAIVSPGQVAEVWHLNIVFCLMHLYQAIKKIFYDLCICFFLPISNQSNL